MGRVNGRVTNQLVIFVVNIKSLCSASVQRISILINVAFYCSFSSFIFPFTYLCISFSFPQPLYLTVQIRVFASNNRRQIYAASQRLVAALLSTLTLDSAVRTLLRQQLSLSFL